MEENQKTSPKSLGIRVISFLIALFILVGVRFALTFISPTTTPAPTPEPTIELTPEPTIPVEWRRDFELNDTAATPNFDITCQEVYFSDTYMLNNYRICVIEIEITNTSSTPQIFSTFTDLKCYSEGSLRNRFLSLDTLNIKTIGGGETINGRIAYVVPPTTTKITLEYDNFLNQDTYTFILNLYPVNF